MPNQRERNAIPSDLRKVKAGSVRFAIKIAYDGTDYEGFQSQPHGRTIQDQIETRLGQMLRRPLRVFGWGRTDSGVHAKGAVISVDLSIAEVERLALGRKKDVSLSDEAISSESLAAKTIHSALRQFDCIGGVGSISALRVIPASPSFDPRFSSLWKRYVYNITYGTRTRSPFLQRYAWHVDEDLDIHKMQEGAQSLTGNHNFQWISVQEAGESRDPRRTLQVAIDRIEIGDVLSYTDEEAKALRISGICDFFLYRMMRRIVGILVGLGRGTTQLSELESCLELHDSLSSAEDTGEKQSVEVPRSLLFTAPARGLCLEHIEYERKI